MSGSKLLLPLTVLALGLVSIGQAQETTDSIPVATQTRQGIVSLIRTQTTAWNEGNLEKFMSTYWKSPQLSFSSGGSTTYGWQETLDRYRRGYAPPKEMGKLNIDNLKVSMLGEKAALVLGNWHLKMSDESVREGNFSLVMRQIKGKWKIVHDHSSQIEPEEDPASTDVSDKNTGNSSNQ